MWGRTPGPRWRADVRAILSRGPGRPLAVRPAWPPRRVLACIDATPSAAGVLSWCGALHRMFSPEVALACAGTVGDDPDQVVLHEQDDAAAATLGAAQATLAGAGIRAAAVPLAGRPADAIPQYCRRARPDAVVLGSHGHRGAHPEAGILRSVKDRVPSHVLVAREAVPGPVLAAYDGSEPSRLAVLAASQFSRAWGTRLDVLQAVPGRAAPPAPAGGAAGAAGVVCLEAQGDARAAVRQAQAAGRHALVVMGSTGRGGAPGWSMGTVSDELLQALPCAALALRPRLAGT